MSTIFLRWGGPAFATVIFGTVAAVTTSGAAIPQDLQARSSTVLSASGLPWAKVEFDMRDATLSGTAADPGEVDDAIARLAAVHGVRSVTAEVTLAEQVRPFPFIATIAAGTVTLSGGVPDEQARAEIGALAPDGVRDELRVLAGAPARESWIPVAAAALDIAQQLDQGEVAVADLAISVSGRAKSADAYRILTAPDTSDLPDGATLTVAGLEPPLASPYEWHAAYDGNRLLLSGVAPTEAVAAELAAIVPTTVPVSTSIQLASGAPAGFADNARLLLQNLLLLQQGSATISGTTLELSGYTADAPTADTIRLAMTPVGAELDLSPPPVSEYRFTAEQRGNSIVLDGFVPDAAMRDRLERMAAVDAAGLELARGAPSRFVSGVGFILDALAHMREGRATLEGTVMSLDGRASTESEFRRLEAVVSLGAPQGLTLKSASIRPPLAVPYKFRAEKTAGGIYSLSGHVPNDGVRKAFAAALPAAPADTLTLADGGPAGFEPQVLKALPVLDLLDTGRIAYDGRTWGLSGAVASPEAAIAVERAFAAAGLKAAGWTYDVKLPEAPAPAVLPTVTPYQWRAQKAADGIVTLTGYLPTDQLKRYLAAHLGSKLVDQTTLATGAPDGFIPAAIAALDALASLDDGAVSLTGSDWSVSGNTATTAGRLAIEAALAGAADVSAWHVAIQASDAAPVAVPFVWSAAKVKDGSYTLSGNVPTEQLRRFLAVRAGKIAKDTTQVSSGGPAGFIPHVLAGLDALLNLQTGEVKYDGKGWSIAGQPATATDLEKAKAALLSAGSDGAGWAQAFADPPPVATPEPPAKQAVAEPQTDPSQVAEASPQDPVPAIRHYLFDARKALGQAIVFEGAVPAEPMRRHLAVISGGEPSETLTIDAALPPDFIQRADAATRALALLADGEFGLDGDNWVFSGRAETDASRDAALAALAAVPGVPWDADVTLLPPLELCSHKVGAFASRNAILFQSGSARIADASLPAIDELAADLALCPEATVNVEGHTDADGDAAANLALSVSRAEAVVDALILRGIDPGRLYAIGYGESLPIASNETRAGKQANRRIAFTLSDE